MYACKHLDLTHTITQVLHVFCMHRILKEVRHGARHHACVRSQPVPNQHQLMPIYMYSSTVGAALGYKRVGLHFYSAMYMNLVVHMCTCGYFSFN